MEDKILQATLDEIKRLLILGSEAISNNEIYEHGYPESRLIPSDFKETCEDEWIRSVNDEVNIVVEEYLSNFRTPIKTYGDVLMAIMEQMKELKWI